MNGLLNPQTKSIPINEFISPLKLTTGRFGCVRLTDEAWRIECESRVPLFDQNIVYFSDNRHTQTVGLDEAGVPSEHLYPTVVQRAYRERRRVY